MLPGTVGLTPWPGEPVSLEILEMGREFAFECRPGVEAVMGGGGGGENGGMG